MRIALFCHTLRSCWNHGNAHFLRGVVTELATRGHDVQVFEPEDSWSYSNLIRAEGRDYAEEFRTTYPLLNIATFAERSLDLDHALAGADLVLVHEWNAPSLARRIAAHRKSHDYLLLFHDTHHRSVTDPAMPDVTGFDGVLAFGESVSEHYRRKGWTGRVWTWHEAADPRVFFPRPSSAGRPLDVVWIGNWGDGERTEELREFFIDPVRELGLRARVYGVRYPPEALRLLDESGIEFGGWIPNFRVPPVFAQARLTVHIPRRPYTRELPGIPTIRVFEALACGIPLISAPWNDCEELFTAGEDFLIAQDKAQVKRFMHLLLTDAKSARALADHGRQTILRRHTCRHRVDQLLRICEELGAECAAARPTMPASHPAMPMEAMA